MGEPADALKNIIYVIEHWTLAEPDFGRQHLIGRGFDVRVVEPWLGEALPELTGEEAGIMLMGGPQYVTALDKAPYLRDELLFAEQAMEKHVPLVGVCLGSQMLAHMLGARVDFHPEDHSTFGFYNLHPTEVGRGYFPDGLKVLAGNAQGWEMPAGVTPLAHGEIFLNQAFQAGEKSIALQFHPEVTRKILDQWQGEFSSMIGKPGTQSIAEQNAGFEAHDPALKDWYAGFLDGWFGRPKN